MKSKRLIAFVLALACLLLCGCERNYKEEKSSKKDRQVVATVGNYEVKYELVRALFYVYKADVDKGDESVWSSPEASNYFSEVMAMVEPMICKIYGTLDFAKQCGIEPFGDKINEQVEAYVRMDIEGGMVGTTEVEGYGSRKAYLEALEERHITDSVNRLLYRYSACISALNTYYVNTYANGAIRVDRESIEAYYQSDDCLHFGWAKLEKSNVLSNEQMLILANTARENLLACTSYEQMRPIILSYSLSLTAEDVEQGLYFSKNSLDAAYQPLIEVAEQLSPLQVSEVISLFDGYYILIGLQKQNSYLDTTVGAKEIETLYLEHLMYQAIDEHIASHSVTFKVDMSTYALPLS